MIESNDFFLFSVVDFYIYPINKVNYLYDIVRIDDKYLNGNINYHLNLI